MGHTHSSALVAVDDQASSVIPFSRSELHKMKEFLPDFYFPTHSTTQHHHVMIAHWDKLFAQATKAPAATGGGDNGGGPTSSPMVVLFDNFYKYLFEMAPQVKPLFRSSMQVQGKALVRIISSIKNMLQSPDLLLLASELAQRHVKYGIELSYFNVLGITLIKTLKSCSEELWTPETEMAWRRVYGHVALIVVTELAKKTAEANRKSSLLMSLSSYRRQSTGAAEPSHHDAAGGKSSSPHHHADGLNPNTKCPMSGNRLKDMAKPKPEPHNQDHHHSRTSATENDHSHHPHHQDGFGFSSVFNWFFGQQHHQHNRAAKYTVETD